MKKFFLAIATFLSTQICYSQFNASDFYRSHATTRPIAVNKLGQELIEMHEVKPYVVPFQKHLTSTPVDAKKAKELYGQKPFTSEECILLLNDLINQQPNGIDTLKTLGKINYFYVICKDLRTYFMCVIWTKHGWIFIPVCDEEYEFASLVEQILFTQTGIPVFEKR